MKPYLSIALLALIFICFPEARQPEELKGDEKIAELLVRLGNPVAKRHRPLQGIEGVSVEKGRQLVFRGRAEKPEGGRSSRISKHFVCTSCHNIQREDPDLSLADPDARLTYAINRDMPFLPATTFFGISNRETYYNGDYMEKYGEELVGVARNSIRQSIQLCATECSQGRFLDPWEVESIVAYFWSLGFEVEDLEWKEGEQTIIEQALSGEANASRAIELIQSKYLTYSPAEFVDPPEDRTKGNGIQGDPVRGKELFIRSCMYCHENERYSMFDLDTNRYSLNFLEKHIPKYDRYSIYQVVRYGTSPKYGKSAYMPHYTIQRMSRRQIEDLRAFIEQGPDLSS